MFGADIVGRGIEILEVAGAYVDGADAETHGSGIDAIKVHQPFQRRLQRCDVVEAFRLDAAGG